MIITIQPLKRGYVIMATETYTYPDTDQSGITRKADAIAKLALLQMGVLPVIKWLPIIKPTMATKKTYPAKKKAVVAKKKLLKAKKK